MLSCNPQRLDYYDRYQTIIQEYNDEKNRAEIERIFDELMKLANDLDQEQKRYIREGFSCDEELFLFDQLSRTDLTKQEISEIKKVAVDLYAKVKARIEELDHCFDKAETKANVQNLILNILWTNLPDCYEDDSITTYRERIYEYFYMRYKDAA